MFNKIPNYRVFQKKISSVMEFLRQWVLINKIFGPNEINVFCKYNEWQVIKNSLYYSENIICNLLWVCWFSKNNVANHDPQSKKFLLMNFVCKPLLNKILYFFWDAISTLAQIFLIITSAWKFHIAMNLS